MLPATLSGTVTPYKGDGRKLGYPTANIAVTTDLQDGVYFGVADLADYHRQAAMIFIGVPETMGEQARRLEAHLIGIEDRDYYGHELTVELLHFHRPNQKFDSIQTLMEAIRQDEIDGQDWLSKNPLA